MVPLVDRLQLERRVFDGPTLLTVLGKLIRCQVPERAMRSMLIVVDAPRFDRGLSVGEGIVNLTSQARFPASTQR